MNDMGDLFRDLKEHRREQRAKWGIKCHGCITKHPKRDPSVLLPNQRCRVCKWQAPHNPEYKK